MLSINNVCIYSATQNDTPSIEIQQRNKVMFSYLCFEMNKRVPFCTHHTRGSFPAGACHLEWFLAQSPKRQAAAF